MTNPAKQPLPLSILTILFSLLWPIMEYNKIYTTIPFFNFTHSRNKIGLHCTGVCLTHYKTNFYPLKYTKSNGGRLRPR